MKKTPEEIQFYERLRDSIQYAEHLLLRDGVSTELKKHVRNLLEASLLTLNRFKDYIEEMDNDGVW